MTDKKSYEAYMMYLALQRHFTSSYNYILYNGKIKVSVDSFEKRRDRYFFTKLSKRKNPFEFALANVIIKQDIWIGDLVNDDIHNENYLAWLKRKESLTYLFKSDLSKFDDQFSSNLISINGQYPNLVNLYLTKEVSIETVSLIERYTNFLNKCTVNDNIIFPDLVKLFQKYDPFISVENNKLKKIIVDKFRVPA